MKYFQVKSDKLAGSSYSEVYRNAWNVYLQEKHKSKRRVYVRSIYFGKEKIFLDIFWSHLKQKSFPDRIRRLKFYCCAVELIKINRIDPNTVQDPNNSENRLHRFVGATKENDVFMVQIKENKKTNQKYFISVFPVNK